MRFMPTLRPGFANLWIMLAIYAALFLYFVYRMPGERRAWLFADPKLEIRGLKKFALRTGQFIAFMFILLACLTPLPSRTPGLALFGVLLYLAGILLVLTSLHSFGVSRSDGPVMDGPYRYSRNPQWIGLFLTMLGVATCGRSRLLVLLVVLIGLIYHIQILAEEKVCLTKYGATYEAYSKTVPRYLFVF
jgi:protein-S-isoprenylcysteine O-methyltransferase Ste14